MYYIAHCVPTHAVDSYQFVSRAVLQPKLTTNLQDLPTTGNRHVRRY